MTPSRTCATLLLPAVLLCSAGCLMVRTHDEVLRRDESKRPVQFQSGFAQRTFTQKALSADERNRSAESSSLGVPFLFLYRKRTLRSEAAFFNDQLALCDADGDGFITDDEVMAFSSGGTRIPTTGEILAERPSDSAAKLR